MYFQSYLHIIVKHTHSNLTSKQMNDANQYTHISINTHTNTHMHTHTHTHTHTHIHTHTYIHTHRVT